MFIEIVGDSALIDQLDLDRDDVEEAITDALGKDGQVTGAGIGLAADNPEWNLDVELEPDAAEGPAIARAAQALIRLGLGTVRIRPEGHQPRPATDLVS
jgi:hypothetical protein